MTVTKFDICTNALLQIGAKAITDFAGGTRESTVCGAIYQTTVDGWLEMYPWRFATKQVTLSRNVTAPDHYWDAKYSEPGDMLALQGVFVGTQPIEYDRFENEIYCNASSTDTVYAVYTYSISETYWPNYFVNLIEVALMQKLSFALPAKLDLREALTDDVEKQFRMAKAADSRQQPSRILPTRGRGSIIEARRS